MSSVARLSNPMRFSFGNRTVPFMYNVAVTEIEMRASEGQVYVHWAPPVCDTCHRESEEMHNWTRPESPLRWTCPLHTAVDAESEVYTQ